MIKDRIGMVTKEPMDYVEVALSLERLRYHNKNYLCSVLCDEVAFSEEIQWLLHNAITQKYGG